MRVLRVQKVELKLEALTGGVLKSAFNNFARFTVKHMCWSLFLIKLQAWLCATFQEKKLWNRGFVSLVSFCKFSQIFNKTYFVKQCPNGCLSEMNQKNVFTKSIHRKTAVMASFLMQLQTYGLTVFPKSDSITDAFLWKSGSFTEHQFYRTMLRGCFWFPVTFSMYYLPYQW